MKSLVAEGLERVLTDRKLRKVRKKPDSRRLPKVKPKGKGVYAITNEDIDHILAEEETSSYGRPR